MKIHKLSLLILRNEEHFNFMSEFMGLIKETTPARLNLVQLFPIFSDLFTKEDRALEVVRKSTLTDPIKDADLRRDSIYRGLVLMVQAYGYSAKAEKVEAARKIGVVINHFGNVRNKSYNEETATIHNFLQRLNTDCLADLATLGAEEWLEDLDAANKSFEALMGKRHDGKAGQLHINLHDTRQEIDAVYHQMIERIDASMLLNGTADFEDFVSKLNQRIDYYKSTLAARKGRNKKKKNGDEDESASEANTEA